DRGQPRSNETRSADEIRPPHDDIDARGEGEALRRSGNLESGGINHRVDAEIGVNGLQRPLVVMNLGAINALPMDGVEAVTLGEPVIQRGRRTEANGPRGSIVRSKLSRPAACVGTPARVLHGAGAIPIG